MSFFCPNCKNEGVSGSRFCPSCGCRLEKEEVENPVCPLCTTVYPAGTKFCAKDGARLLRPEEVTPKCVLCGRTYGAEVAFCPADGGVVRILPVQSVMEHKVTRMYYKATTAPYPKASLSLRLGAWMLDLLVVSALYIPSLFFFIAALGKFWTHQGGYGFQGEYNFRNLYDLYYEWYRNSAEGNVFFLFLGFSFLLLPVVYFLFRDAMGTGQSLGKKAMGLITLELKTHRPCRWGHSFVRNITVSVLYYLSFWLWFLIEPVLVLVLPDGRKLSDRISGTQVVEKSFFLSAAPKTDALADVAEDSEKDTAENL